MTAPTIMTRAIAVDLAISLSASTVSLSIVTSSITLTYDSARTSTFTSDITFTAPHLWARSSALASISPLGNTSTNFGAAHIWTTRTPEHPEVEASRTLAVSGVLAARSCVAFFKLFAPLLGSTLLFALDFCFPGFPLALRLLCPNAQLLLLLGTVEPVETRRVILIAALAVTTITAHIDPFDR